MLNYMLHYNAVRTSFLCVCVCVCVKLSIYMYVCLENLIS